MEKASVPYVIYMNTAPTKVAIDPNCQADPFYRYKMSQMQVQVIGNGKMVRTSLVNLEDVAKDLNLPPSCTCTFAQTCRAEANVFHNIVL